MSSTQGLATAFMQQIQCVFGISVSIIKSLVIIVTLTDCSKVLTVPGLPSWTLELHLRFLMLSGILF